MRNLRACTEVVADGMHKRIIEYNAKLSLSNKPQINVAYFVILCLTKGYVCEEYNNPPDFFLDIINGDSTAVKTLDAMGMFGYSSWWSAQNFFEILFAKKALQIV